MKGIILAGGHGTRLFPLTQFTSKQLLPVYDKPMIYYPLSTLMLGGVNEIAIISTPRDLPNYEQLLGDGSKWGLQFTYIEQVEPKGLADAFILASDFIGEDSVSLILGDNIFYGNMRLQDVFNNFKEGALVFGYPVSDPERYGILEFDEKGVVIDICEKPSNPKSRFAVPGLYIYDNRVVNFAKNLEPSDRGEIEITDINKKYMLEKDLKVVILGRGVAWLDTGTSDSLQEASSFVQSIEQRQSFKIGCPEEIALRKKLITIGNLEQQIGEMPNSDYKEYLSTVANEFKFNNGKRAEGIESLQL